MFGFWPKPIPTQPDISRDTLTTTCTDDLSQSMCHASESLSSNSIEPSISFAGAQPTPAPFVAVRGGSPGAAQCDCVSESEKLCCWPTNVAAGINARGNTSLVVSAASRCSLKNIDNTVRFFVEPLDDAGIIKFFALSIY